MRKLLLPDWANVICPGKIEMDADGFYTDWLDRLGVTNPTVYWLECAKICARMEIQLAVSGTDQAATQGGALLIIINDNSKATGKWSQAKASTESDLENRSDAEAADIEQAGKKARENFKRVMQINL